MNFRNFATERRYSDTDGLPSMSIYGTSPDSAPAMAWLSRLRSDSDVVEESRKEHKSSSQPIGSKSKGLTTEESKGSIEVVSDTVVSYNGMTRMAPGYIRSIQHPSSLERFEKCNSCDDLLKVFNQSTKSWDLLRGKDLNKWETVSNK